MRRTVLFLLYPRSAKIDRSDYEAFGAKPCAHSNRPVYVSANGDRWLLAVDPDSGRVFVRHEPNLSSGGQVADIEIGAFLIAAGNGPEKQELLRLIATLV